MLRFGLIAGAHARNASELKQDLAGSVYGYVTSNRFCDLVRSALEQVANEMSALERDCVAHECRFAERQERLRGFARGWATVVGDLLGIGADLPEIPVFSVLAGNTNSERQAEKDK
jgi:superfamily II DNA or RNA helicase